MKIMVMLLLLTGCAESGINLMPGDPDTGCTRMISHGEAETDNPIADAGAGYCKYIEMGKCPEMSQFTFDQFKEMCREL